MQNNQQQLEGLREQLLKTKKWPLRYMFKFVMPNDKETLAVVQSMMPEGGTVSYKNSANGKYVAMTYVVNMPDADSIVSLTSNVAALPGVMSL
ncbi:MAG: hypothetical protein MJZ31_05470 [Bacteroidales bacterium]|nr:hypothetical protein [Bacteroidales bacterium]